jgi:acyl carrier protein
VSADAREVLELLVRRAALVMAVDESGLSAETRMDEDLHADSLDLVEIVEGVEADLRARGYDVTVPEEELLSAATVGAAADALARHTSSPS